MEEKQLDPSENPNSSTTEPQLLSTNKKEEYFEGDIKLKRSVPSYGNEYSQSVQKRKNPRQQKGLESGFLSRRRKSQVESKHGDDIPGSSVMETRVSEKFETNSGPIRDCSADPTLDEKNKASTTLADPICYEITTPKLIATSGGSNFSYSKEIIKNSTKTNEKLAIACDFCNKVFNCSSVYEAHVRVHAGEKPFECQFCDKRFTYNSVRNMHVRMHTGERPFRCQECGKAFHNSANLKVHSVVHTNERPYVCCICGRGYKSKKSLMSHGRTH